MSFRWPCGSSPFAASFCKRGGTSAVLSAERQWKTETGVLAEIAGYPSGMKPERPNKSFDTDAQVLQCALRTRFVCAGQLRR